MGAYRRGFEPRPHLVSKLCACVLGVCACVVVCVFSIVRFETNRAASSALSLVSMGAQKFYMTHVLLSV